jgi:hypothetical protein
MTSQLVRVLGAVLLFAASLGAAAASAPKFDRLERELHLRPEQKMQFDIAVASTQRALLGVALTALQLKQQVVDELAKPRPDFSSLADAHEQLMEQNRPLFKAAGEEWKKFCALLDDDQLDIAKTYLRDNLDGLFGKLGSIDLGSIAR